MEISFESNKLSKVFNSKKKLIQEYGPRNAEVIMRRMIVLQAAPSLNDVPHRPPERRHELGQNRAGQFAVDLMHPYRLVFRPNHDTISLKADGGIDLKQVTAITIIEVEDYH